MKVLSGHTEQYLLKRSAEGEDAAFAELFIRYKFKLFGFVYKLTQSAEMSEDVVQDVFLQLWRNKTSLAGIDNFSAYLFRVAQNQCLNAFKRMARQTALIKQLLTGEAPFVPDTPESALALKEIEALFKKAIDQLPPQQKRVYQLSREQGMKHEEIAEYLQIAPGTVKNHMVQLLRTLRKQLEKNHHPPAVLYCFLLVIAAFQK